jgi:hypothetical protein
MRTTLLPKMRQRVSGPGHEQVMREVIANAVAKKKARVTLSGCQAGAEKWYCLRAGETVDSGLLLSLLFGRALAGARLLG